jgi:hypothetical protein
MTKEVLEFANKLTGAWASEDKDWYLLFDAPDIDKYPYWFFQIKFTPFDEFAKKRMFLHNPVFDIFRLEYEGVLGRCTDVLKFIDDDTLEVRTLFNKKEIVVNLHREKDVESLFEVKN